MFSRCERRFGLPGSPPVFFGSRALNCGPDMAVMIEDSLHYMSVNQTVLYFRYLVCEAFDLLFVNIGLLLIMSFERHEQVTGLSMVIGVRHKV
jgi:hypothetical protein